MISCMATNDTKAVLVTVFVFCVQRHQGSLAVQKPEEDEDEDEDDELPRTRDHRKYASEHPRDAGSLRNFEGEQASPDSS